ncbi:MAG: heavy metal-responsive transcriptional regulator [Acidobacteria bacterium]|nr:heavy metal-responsive transcriptional regulator [Acidobacteriota bacterium]
MAQSEFRIGEVAASVGVSIDTVRYYERRRLLPHASRTRGGYRVFNAEVVERIRFIKQAQDIGLSLKEVGELLSNGGGANECRRVRDLLRTKLIELDERLKMLREFRRTLAHYLDECESELNKQGEAAECPVMVAITHTDTRKGKKK